MGYLFPDLLFSVGLGCAVIGAICWWSILLLPWRPASVRENIEPAVAIRSGRQLNDITVLIPARNEAQFIQHTIDTVKIQGDGIEIIVIDDQSTDETAQLARKKGAKVISGTAPLPGWSGKLWALEQGLRKVKTPYTLLLDADIALSPGTIATIRDKLETEQRALVSLMAAPSLDNVIERFLMPAFIFFFKLLYPFGLANKPTSRLAAAAGGCILVKTQALHSVGAFKSLHNAMIDDCTLATHIKNAGNKIWVGLSHAAQSHRGYLSLYSIWEMVARTAYTQLNYSLMLLILCTVIMLSMSWVAPFIFLLLPNQNTYMISALTWVAMFFAYSPTLIYYQRSLFWVLSLPFIGTLYLAMTWTSAIRYWRGERARWKGRQYESKTSY